MEHMISLGAGVQSSTMALLAMHGEITPMPTAAIFADTGWEPKEVMEHLAFLELILPFPVYRVRKDGPSIPDELSGVGRYSAVPFFTENGGLARRNCTRDFKVLPIQRKQRELLGYKKYQRIPAGSITTWIGISSDESLRMKPSPDRWVINRWPLIELGMTRQDCLDWCQQQGYPQPPKSSCLGCPFHSDKVWAALKATSPDEWAETVLLDAVIRDRGLGQGMRERQFMHRSRIPLGQVTFDHIVQTTDYDAREIDNFTNECEGLCGV